MVRHFLSQCDLSASEVRHVFQQTGILKLNPINAELAARTLVMFFEKASTRTRLSFEIGMTQLGGHAVYLDRDSSQLSRGESVGDTAQVVSRYADIMMARVYAHATIVELARYSSVPVINGLSDEEHPCQSMADLFTVRERKGSVEGLRIAYVGDGNNNVAHSLAIGAAQLGAHVSIGCPEELAPHPRYVELARSAALETGGSVTVTCDPGAAVMDADVVYTDVWVSMGREDDRERRLRALQPFQVNEQLVSHAKGDFIFMHCLPAHVGEEVTEGVAYGPHSVIFDQAENRLHVQKALILFLLDKSNQGERG